MQSINVPASFAASASAVLAAPVAPAAPSSAASAVASEVLSASAAAGSFASAAPSTAPAPAASESGTAPAPAAPAAPIFLGPVFIPKIWGGRNLATEWGYSIPEGPIGECWAVSAHPHGCCRVRGGAYDGLLLSELWERKRMLFGQVPQPVADAAGGAFPLLVKILDVWDPLSVQVHPGDAYAAAHEGGQSGKRECWYVLSAEPGAKIVVGQRARSREEFARLVAEGRWEELLNEVPVRAGDLFQISPGTVHAILPGVQILETQQSSDLTYRVYDFDRVGADGLPRELHMQKALDVIDFAAPLAHGGARPANALVPGASGVARLAACDRFVVDLVRVTGPVAGSDEAGGPSASGPGIGGALELPALPTFCCASVVAGAGEAAGVPVRKGDHFIWPAGAPLALSGAMEVVLSRVPLEEELHEAAAC